MHMSDKKTILPKLRFQEFNSYPEWEITTLGAISEPIEEKVGSRNCILMSVTAGKGLVPQKEKFGREIAGNSYKNYYVIRENDFAYNKSATKQFPEGYIAMLTDYDEAALPNSIFTCFRITEKECEPAFINHLFQSNYHGKWLRKYIEVGARAHGSLNVDCNYLWSMPIALPKKKEQVKIAEILSEIDKLIISESSKLDFLQTHKNGLMQKFFPSCEDSFPKLRFKEFFDKRIDFKSGDKLFDPISNKDHKCDLPVLAISQEHGAIPREKIDYNVFVSDKSLESYKVVEIGDFIISLRSFQGGIEYSVYRGICSPAYIILRKKIDICDQYFKYYFKTKKFIADLNKNLEGIRDGKMVSYSQFSELVLPVPDKKEQQKIANCLCSVDDLINTQATKIEELRNHKKGLLQQLFPSFEEVIK